MRSRLDRRPGPKGRREATSARLKNRPRGARYRGVLVGGVVAVVFVATMAVVGAFSTPAYADTTIDGCTIVTHPSAHRFTDCPDANLSGANLAGVNLSFADLSGAQFVNCLTQLPFTCSNSTVLVGSDLKDANLSDSRLFGVDLSSTNLRRANLSGASLDKCLPVFLYAPGCDPASLADTDLRGANLSDASTSTCLAVDLGGVIGIQDICGGVSMSDADLSGANLTGDDLSFAVLSDDNLKGANLAGVTFSECPAVTNPQFQLCSTADLAGVTLKGVDLSGLQMNGVDLAGADLSGANLSNGNLSPLVYPQVPGYPPPPVYMITNLSGADLKHADLQGADLSSANLSGVNWAHATCPDGTNSVSDMHTCVNNLG
jgi:uncharacterized protein YjbI with pentapeptide repeats